MPFNLKIILTFSVYTNTIVNIVQFKILNRKCSFSIQLNSIKFKKKYSLVKVHSDRKKFQFVLIHSRVSVYTQLIGN